LNNWGFGGDAGVCDTTGDVDAAGSELVPDISCNTVSHPEKLKIEETTPSKSAID